MKCDICDAEVKEAYVIDDGAEIYCSDDCLSGAYSPEEYDELCQEGRAEWKSLEE